MLSYYVILYAPQYYSLIHLFNVNYTINIYTIIIKLRSIINDIQYIKILNLISNNKSIN